MTDVDLSSLGYNEGYIQSIRRFLQAIENETRQCHSNKTIRLSGFHWGGPNILQYEEFFLPLWKRFVDALLLRARLQDEKSGTVRHFKICHIELNPAILDLLEPVFLTTAGATCPFQFVTLELSNVNLGSRGIQLLTSHLAQNSRLSMLVIQGNPIHDLSCLPAFAKAVRDHYYLEDLFMADCEISDDHFQLASLALVLECESLQTLDLSNNSIASFGAQILADFIATNNNQDQIDCFNDCEGLQYLNLLNNYFHEQDIQLFAQALQQNKSLKCLNLGRCNILSKQEANSLFQCICNTTNLNALTTSSNHTCRIWICDKYGHDMEHFHGINKSSDTNENKHQKLGRILFGDYASNIQLQYLENLPINLLPLLLESIPQLITMMEYEYMVENKIFTIIYQVMRNWKMPLIFENNIF